MTMYHRLVVTKNHTDQHGNELGERVVYSKDVNGWKAGKEAAAEWSAKNDTTDVLFEIFTLDDDGNIDPSETMTSFTSCEMTPTGNVRTNEVSR